MPSKRQESQVVETYARTLLEAAKSEGHVFRDLNEIEVIAGASKETLAVVAAMRDAGQLDLLPKVAASYKQMTEEDEDVVGVTVTTAVELDDDLRATITKKCEDDLKAKVFLIEKVDPSIIGGLILEARGERRDISVKTQLRAAREALGSTTTSNGGEA